MKPVTIINQEICILKAASCLSLSGKSTLSYQIGYGVNGVNSNRTEPVIQLRVYANSGGGFFNKDWIALSNIQQLLEKCPSNKPITSFVLYPLFQGRSINTPAFLLAVLKHEGFLRPLKDKQRSYERLDPNEFMTEIKSLIEAIGTASTADTSMDSASIVDPNIQDKHKNVENKPKQAMPSKTAVTSKKVAPKTSPNKA
ncbi:hypothetical protein [Candidatus Nitrotoga sp. 1052]|uniref:hypothetical protein n=1 Tax=Candidatus Nitrotoga sp. 1052 TaxID=2886964 RepID=UPI001EF5713C|nr:hypothetical protein [Candidatus Nitrotoga sp. 1052]CAH1083759.1 hypothetical protein NTG1052_490002 [Candidatus Nitrotoga sp. 1052]